MIRLPPEITFDKRPLPGKGILLQDLPGRGTHVSCEVAGDADDPRTAERRAIFEPLGLEIARQMERSTGPSTDTRPYAAPSPPAEPAADRVEGKLTQCPRCGEFVAMLAFAPGATDAGRFEDYARLMYPEYSQRGLPTWIIGPALGAGPEDPADILQVWPTRKRLQRLTPRQFNPRLDRLAARHCR